MMKINKEIAKRMIQEMPESKKSVLSKALDRNEILTSARVLSYATIFIYKEGFLLKLEGTRCQFTVFAKDNDGELEFIRKPKDSLLNLIYTDGFQMNEADYRII